MFRVLPEANVTMITSYRAVFAWDDYAKALLDGEGTGQSESVRKVYECIRMQVVLVDDQIASY